MLVKGAADDEVNVVHQQYDPSNFPLLYEIVQDLSEYFTVSHKMLPINTFCAFYILL